MQLDHDSEVAVPHSCPDLAFEHNRTRTLRFLSETDRQWIVPTSAHQDARCALSSSAASVRFGGLCICVTAFRKCPRLCGKNCGLPCSFCRCYVRIFACLWIPWSWLATPACRAEPYTGQQISLHEGQSVLETSWARDGVRVSSCRWVSHLSLETLENARQYAFAITFGLM